MLFEKLRHSLVRNGNVETNQRQLEDAEQVAHFGSWEWDSNFDCTFCSRGLFSIFGLDQTQTELSFETFMQLIDPSDRERLVDALKSATLHKSDFDLELKINRTDGVCRSIYTHGRCFFNENGKLMRTVGTMKDVTERRQAENELKKSESLFRGIVENSLVGVWKTDSNFLHMHMNGPMVFGKLFPDMGLAGLGLNFQGHVGTKDLEL